MTRPSRTSALWCAVALSAAGLVAAAPAANAAGPAAGYARACAPAHAHPGRAACLALVRTDTAAPSPATTPSGYGPADLQQAYKLPSNGGAGQTVAVVTAYDDPNAAADLAAYRAEFGLPACTAATGCFRKVAEDGGAGFPPADAGWAEETSIDLDMVSAVAPAAHLLLVEAAGASMPDLGTAVDQAVAQGAHMVSTSFGGSEDLADQQFDAEFFNHPGVAITAASGDAGYGVEYPAASPHVTAVGGTTLSRTLTGWSETAWGTGGCSAYEPRPAWQSATVTGCKMRGVNDVAAVADPQTGVAFYDSYQAPGWAVAGGTSVASPIIAGVYADAGTPGASDYPVSYPWLNHAGLYDVPPAGWDPATGWGTPRGTASFRAPVL